MNIKRIAIAFGLWGILLAISPASVRVAIAAAILPTDMVHVFNAEVRDNADGTATILGVAKK